MKNFLLSDTLKQLSPSYFSFQSDHEARITRKDQVHEKDKEGSRKLTCVSLSSHGYRLHSVNDNSINNNNNNNNKKKKKKKKKKNIPSKIGKNVIF